MLTREEILKILKDSNALLEGHFLLTSGLHSPQYVEKFRILERPDLTQLLCKDIAEHFRNEKPNIVIGPMTGGIILAYEVARQLGIKFCFTERTEGKMTLKRGFQLSGKNKVLIVEDVVTTGGSVFEVIDEVKRHHAKIIGIGYLVDRSNGKVDFHIPSKPLITLEVVNYTPEVCPLCKSGSKPSKPGSTNK